MASLKAMSDGPADALLSTLDKDLFRHISSLRGDTQEGVALQLSPFTRSLPFYPEILTGHFAHLVNSLLTKVYGLARVQVLECLTRCVHLEKLTGPTQPASSLLCRRRRRPSRC